jgi:hypothetical protein
MWSETPFPMSTCDSPIDLLLLTLDLNLADVLWCLGRYLSGSLLTCKVRRIAKHAGPKCCNPLPRMLRVWRLEAVALTGTCMSGMTQACASTRYPSAASASAGGRLRSPSSLPLHSSSSLSLALGWTVAPIISRHCRHADTSRWFLPQTS